MASRASWNSKDRVAFFRFEDPLAAETVSVEGHTYPMAANFTASLAMGLAQEKPQKLGLMRLLRPEEYASTFRVARIGALRSKQIGRACHPWVDGHAGLAGCHC